MAGAGGAQLRLGGGRHRGGDRADPRLRAAVRRRRIGNFWVDLTRATLYVLLPISIVAALVLVLAGRDPELRAVHRRSTTLEGATQMIAQGPVASQEAIKMLGTNGGGFFNANSAHPFENPTPLTNFVADASDLPDPGAALTYTFGQMVGDTRQGWALFAAMSRAVPRRRVRRLLGASRPAIRCWRSWASRRASATQSGGNMEGKEVALRHRRLRALRHRHHGRQLRRGQLDARQLHAARRPGAAGQHPDSAR